MGERICANCKSFAALSPGHAAICFDKWKDLPWHAAVPLTRADDSCEHFEAKVGLTVPE